MKNAPVTEWDITAAALLVPRVLADDQSMTHRITQTAQFLADLQASAAHKAWREGYDAKVQRRSEDANPYPKLEP